MERENKIDDYIIIDIRDKDEYLKDHIKDSINLSYINLLINPEKYLNKNKKYMIVCKYGYKSQKISEILRKNGYKIMSLQGGYQKNT